MKTKITVALFAVLVLTFCINYFVSSPAHGNSSGPPAGQTGSPGDAANCTGCHGSLGPANFLPNATWGFITSNVPLTGYAPGATYSFTLNATVPAGGTSFNKRIGFQISPQNTAGQQKGTLIVTNSAHTQLVGSGKYLTHKLAGIVPTSSGKSWSFNWTAPAAGNGAVTFYAAMVFADSSFTTTGDSVVTTSYTINEGTIGINDFTYNDSHWSVYPNPSSDKLHIKSLVLNNQKINCEIIDITGKKVKVINDLTFAIEDVIDISELNIGLYSLSIYTDSGVVNKKFIKK